MFSDVIQRWICMAKLSDEKQVRLGFHSRHSEWPYYLICVEKARVDIDIALAWTVALKSYEINETMIAFSMATHPRLGSQSHALGLIPDIVKLILNINCQFTIEQAHREALLQQTKLYTDPFHKSSNHIHCFNVERLLLNSEINDSPAFKWPGRNKCFFSKHGWLCGIPHHLGPADTQNDSSVTGIFKSVPHIFCGTRFPICRPYEVCIHLIKVCRNQP